MTHFAELLDALGWSSPYVAERFGVSRQKVDAWRTGRNTRGNEVEAPVAAIAWLEQMRALLRACPAPRLASGAPEAA